MHYPEKPQNCTPKMPNVTSETQENDVMLLAPFSSCCCYEFFGYLFLLLLQRLLLLRRLVPGWKTPWKKSPPGGETPCL